MTFLQAYSHLSLSYDIGAVLWQGEALGHEDGADEAEVAVGVVPDGFVGVGAVAVQGEEIGVADVILADLLDEESAVEPECPNLTVAGRAFCLFRAARRRLNRIVVVGAVVGELGFVFVDLRELGDTLDGGGLAEVVELVKVVEQVKDVRAVNGNHVVDVVFNG